MNEQELAAVIIIVLLCVVAIMIIHIKNMSHNARMEQFERMEKDLLKIKKTIKNNK